MGCDPAARRPRRRSAAPPRRRAAPTIVALSQPSALPRMRANTRQKSPPLKVTTPAQSTRGPRLGAVLVELQQRHDDGQRADRHVHEEDPLPAEALGERAAHERAHGHRRADRGPPDAEGGATLAPWNSWAISAGAQANITAPPIPWKPRARLSTVGEPASPQSSEARLKRTEADGEHAPAAEQVGQRPGGEQHRRQHQRVGVHDPLEVGEAGVQLALDVRQRDVHHRDVQQQHERAEADGDEGPATALSSALYPLVSAISRRGPATICGRHVRRRIDPARSRLRHPHRSGRQLVLRSLPDHLVAVGVLRGPLPG